jgi:hypothetical protein
MTIADSRSDTELFVDEFLMQVIYRNALIAIFA